MTVRAGKKRKIGIERFAELVGVEPWVLYQELWYTKSKPIKEGLKFLKWVESDVMKLVDYNDSVIDEEHIDKHTVVNGRITPECIWKMMIIEFIERYSVSITPPNGVSGEWNAAILQSNEIYDDYPFSANGESMLESAENLRTMMAIRDKQQNIMSVNRIITEKEIVRRDIIITIEYDYAGEKMYKLKITYVGKYRTLTKFARAKTITEAFIDLVIVASVEYE